MSGVLINAYFVTTTPTVTLPAVVEGSFQAHLHSEINRSTYTATHTTVKEAQDGNTAIIWVVTMDGNSANVPWSSDEGLATLFSVDGDTFGDDLIVFIEFPAWVSTGTEIVRTFTEADGAVDQGVNISSFEVENLASTGYLDAVGSRHSTSATSADVNVTATESNVLLLFVSASESAVPVSETITNSRDFTILLHETAETAATTPYTTVAVKVVNAGVHTSPTVTTDVGARKTMALAALKSA